MYDLYVGVGGEALIHEHICRAHLLFRKQRCFDLLRVMIDREVSSIRPMLLYVPGARGTLWLSRGI
jgi:hypothetical protein